MYDKTRKHLPYQVFRNESTNTIILCIFDMIIKIIFRNLFNFIGYNT